MKLQVIDSEKTSKLFLANAKENMILANNLKNLEISERTVENRISSDQKVLYRRFQKKLQHSELTLARLRGDKEKEKQLRQRKHQCNTSLADEDEVTEVLKRIWRQGSAMIRRNRKEARPRRAKSACPSAAPKSKSTASRQNVSSPEEVIEHVARRNRPVKAVRPHTAIDQPTIVVPTTNPGGTAVKAQYISTGVGEDDSSVQSKSRTQRPRTAPHKLCPQSPQRPASSLSAATVLANSDPWEQARSELLHCHRSNLEAAGYGRRIRRFCDSLEPYTHDKGRFIQDYYFRCLSPPETEILNEEKDTDFGSGVRRNSCSDAELRRASGNPRIRSLTVKALNFDFES